MRQTTKSDFDFGARQERLLSAMEQRGLAALLVTDLFNIAYLTAFRASAGVALFSSGKSILWVDPRYTLAASQVARGVAVREAKKGLLAAAAKWLLSHPRGVVGIDDANLTVKAYQGLRAQTNGRIQFRGASGIVEELRSLKDPFETERIRVAAEVTAAAFEDLVPRIKPGAEERELAAELEYRMRTLGAEGAAFETIVASGYRGAYPHARPSRKLLEKCDLVIFDVGAIVDGYAADMTRTLSLGKPSNRIRRLYNAVLEAQERGINAAQRGVRAGFVDLAVRSSLRRRKLDQYFTHSTGHGLGMEVHERPRVAYGDKSRLEAGSVITIEPGIYIEGLGGIRIEDTVLIGSAGPEILTPASKTDWILE
jgi:Xaa-Pro aminopeptidase